MDNYSTSLLIKFLLQSVGLLEWAYLTLLLMEVAICKDARRVNTKRILESSFRARLRLFTRSFKNEFYRASVALFIGSLIAVFTIINEMWTGFLPLKKYSWVIFSCFFPLAIASLYHYQGYYVTFFRKFKLFWDGKQD